MVGIVVTISPSFNFYARRIALGQYGLERRGEDARTHVEDRSLSCGVQSDHEDTHFLFTKQSGN